MRGGRGGGARVQVKQLGSSASSARTAEQALTASFWNDGAGTSTAVGHFYTIALQVGTWVTRHDAAAWPPPYGSHCAPSVGLLRVQVIPAHFSTSQQVRFFTVLFSALSDVSIPCFK